MSSLNFNFCPYFLFIMGLCLFFACKNQTTAENSEPIPEMVNPSPPTPLQIAFTNQVCECYSLHERSQKFNTITRNFRQCVSDYSQNNISSSKQLLVDFKHVKEASTLPSNYEYAPALSNLGNLNMLRNCNSYREDLMQFKTNVVQQTGQNLSPVKENIQNLEASLYEIKDNDKLASVYYMIGILYEYDENEKQALKYYSRSAALKIQNNQLGEMFMELLKSK